jgi:hypothetical protein
MEIPRILGRILESRFIAAELFLLRGTEDLRRLQMSERYYCVKARRSKQRRLALRTVTTLRVRDLSQMS